MFGATVRRGIARPMGRAPVEAAVEEVEKMTMSLRIHPQLTAAGALWISVLASCTGSMTGTDGAPNPATTAPSVPASPQGSEAVAPGVAGAASTPAMAPIGTLPTTPVMTIPPPQQGPSGVAGAAAPSGGDIAPPPTAAGLNVPCDTQRVVAASCTTCHGTTLLGGAPMPLLTYADWHKPSISAPTLKVYELSGMRLQDQARPMPPGGNIAATDKATLAAWIAGGAVGSSAPADAMCAPPPTTGAGMPTTAGGSPDGSYGEIFPGPGEKCYDFPVHASTTDVNDKTPYDVGTGEHYEQFYYDVPWPAGTVATRYGAKLDNVKVLHHWLLFKTSETDPEGSHKTSELPTLAGVDAQLLAGWAVGGSNMAPPDDVGFDLPDPGAKLNVQWHFYNSTSERQADASVVQVCTVPRAMRKNVATLSWLGQEDLNGIKWLGGPGMPAHQESTFTGTCNPRRRNMNATDPINIVIFWPHMHQLGTHMTAVINRKDGTKEIAHDKPFDFSTQDHFQVNYKLFPGDTITTTCKYNNTTDMGVPFGESSDSEMCYMFTYAWPANALENGATSLLGASNTCW
jgi:cytochrome c5